MSEHDEPDFKEGSMNVDLVGHDDVVYVRLTANSGGVRTHFCLILRWPEAVQLSNSLMAGAIEAASECGADKETIQEVLDASQLAHLEGDDSD